VRRLGWLSALVLAGALGVASAQGAPSSAAGVSPAPRCDLGHVSGDDAGVETAVLAKARVRFERSLTGSSPRAQAGAGARFVTDLAAYVYGYPIVIVRRTILTFPVNKMVSIGKLADTSTQSIVAPNHDTLYSVAQLNLASGPVVIQTPPTGGRYSVIQLTDGFTNVAAYLGDGARARTGESAAVVPPGWHHSLPAGLGVVRPATRLVWLLGRTLASGTTDTAAAVRLLARYSVTPLAAYVSGTRTPPLVLADFPHRTPVTVPADATFYDELGRDLVADPPPARDACAIGAFAHAGIGAGRTPSAMLTGLNAKALSAAARAGRGILQKIVQGIRHAPSQVLNGWETTPPDTARFGDDYVGRAVVAAIGLGANTNAKALYLTEDRDSAQRSLNGSHVYAVRFRAGQLPPVSAFWSLTLYNRHILFYPNRLNRYALGDRSRLRRDPGGGLTITVSHRAPPAARRSNWLPAPAGAFSLYLRLYEPRPAALDHKWMPPSIVRIGSPS
jgi:hypothetical protein